MAHVKASPVCDSEQMVSGQEKAGLPLPGKGSEKERGLREGSPGIRTGHLSLAGTGGQMGGSDKDSLSRRPGKR